MQLLCSRTCSAQPATRWLVGRLSALASRATPPRLALTPRTRRMQRCGRPSRRRLRVRRRPAPPEPTGPRHRGRLAGDRPKKRNCAFTRSNSSRNLDFLNAFASPLQVAKRSNCAFSTVRGQRLSPAVDNDSLEVTTSTRSRTRSSRRDGRCACHARPSTRRRGWTSSATEWRCSTRTAAMAPRCAYVPPHTPATVGGATRSDPQLLSIASSGSPECRMRCAIAHF